MVASTHLEKPNKTKYQEPISKKVKFPTLNELVIDKVKYNRNKALSKNNLTHDKKQHIGSFE